MLILHWTFVGLYLMFSHIVSASSTFTLSRFQSITGYSDKCATAYNTPLIPCTAQDFEPDRPCSQACVNFLDDLTHTINEECQGNKAYPDSLIGMFFISEGTTVICPNARGSTGSPDVDGGDARSIIIVTSTIKPSNVPEAQDTSANTPKPNISTVTSSTTTSHKFPDHDPATVTTSVNLPDPSTPSVVQTSVTTIPLSALTPAPTPAAESTEKTPRLKATSGGGDGGGTPFDITSSSFRQSSPKTLGASVLVGLAILAWCS